ncbi:WD domain-containing protein [Phytophthora cinnamomi]|uniref:WD domain-containing protein n=1 Tax=Phytophthora cinnamomi TaxID=4785 RepID=UPI00355A45D1|nr:WD domain-containing protein [Phytophthora cinnamomi]
MQRLKLDETALDLFARRPTRSFSTELSFLDAATVGRDGSEAGFRPRQVVELCGASDTPKAQVLEHVVASFVTKSCKERVFVFDHECDVSAERLQALVAHRLAGSRREDALQETLGRVQTCHCRDSFQWLATLNHIHFQLLGAPPAPLMLVFNCVGSFHVIDKMTARSVGDGLALSEQVFIFLKQFIRHHSPIVFAAKETAKSARNSWEHPEYLPSSWTSQVSKRILLRIPPPPRQSLDRHKYKKDEQGCSNLNDSDRGAHFEARCIVGGESRVYTCRVEGNTVYSTLLGPPAAPAPAANTNTSGLLNTLSKRPPLVCTFYYETQVFTRQIQLPLLYETPAPGTRGTTLVDLEMELREKLQLPFGSSVFAVVPADELYSPPYPFAMINLVAARLEETSIPVLHFVLVVRNMALLKQPLPMGDAFESPFFAVNAATLADPTNSVARTLARRRFVQNMQTYGFARLEITPDQAKIPQIAFERVRKWLVEQLALPKEKRWIDYVDVDKRSEKNGGEDAEDNPSDSLYTSHPVVSRGRRVGFSSDRNREYMQLRLPIAASGTPWPPVYFQDGGENEELANELLTLLELLDDMSRSCMKAVCEVLNIDERWVFEELLDDRTRASKTCERPRDTHYQYGASVLRIYNYRNKAENCQGPAEVNPNDNSCGVHADLGLVTVSPLATVPGLQMWNLERMLWADVEESATPLQFSVFAGETLGLLTHGVISAPLHRVPPICVETEAERRMSMPYFLRAKPEACLNPKAPTAEQITCRDFMEDVVFKKRPWRRENSKNPSPPDY